MNPEPATDLFRSHATARLRGNTAEAARLAAQIGPGQLMTHQLFLVSLLAQAVVEEYGAQPDPSDLAAITKRLHDKHFATNPSFNALRAEAMVRAVCGDSVLLTEIPHAEQPAYLWAAIGELIEPDLTDAQLAELFDLAEEYGLECLTEAFEDTIRNHPRRAGQQEPPPEPPADDPTSETADNDATNTTGDEPADTSPSASPRASSSSLPRTSSEASPERSSDIVESSEEESA